MFFRGLGRGSAGRVVCLGGVSGWAPPACSAFRGPPLLWQLWPLVVREAVGCVVLVGVTVCCPFCAVAGCCVVAVAVCCWLVASSGWCVVAVPVVALPLRRVIGAGREWIWCFSLLPWLRPALQGSGLPWWACLCEKGWYGLWSSRGVLCRLVAVAGWSVATFLFA